MKRTIVYAFVAAGFALVSIFFKHDLSQFTGEATDAILSLGSIFALVATIRSHIKAQADAKKTIPGGPFNPKAEIRKAEKVKK